MKNKILLTFAITGTLFLSIIMFTNITNAASTIPLLGTKNKVGTYTLPDIKDAVKSQVAATGQNPATFIDNIYQIAPNGWIFYSDKELTQLLTVDNANPIPAGTTVYMKDGIKNLTDPEKTYTLSISGDEPWASFNAIGRIKINYTLTAVDAPNSINLIVPTYRNARGQFVFVSPSTQGNFFTLSSTDHPYQFGVLTSDGNAGVTSADEFEVGGLLLGEANQITVGYGGFSTQNLVPGQVSSLSGAIKPALISTGGEFYPLTSNPLTIGQYDYAGLKTAFESVTFTDLNYSKNSGDWYTAPTATGIFSARETSTGINFSPIPVSEITTTGQAHGNELPNLKNIGLCVVAFDTNGGSKNPETQLISCNETATQPENPTKDNEDFAKWYACSDKDKKDFNFNTEITSNINLCAYWELPGAPSTGFNSVSFNSIITILILGATFFVISRKKRA